MFCVCGATRPRTFSTTLKHRTFIHCVTIVVGCSDIHHTFIVMYGCGNVFSPGVRKAFEDLFLGYRSDVYVDVGFGGLDYGADS